MLALYSRWGRDGLKSEGVRVKSHRRCLYVPRKYICIEVKMVGVGLL